MTQRDLARLVGGRQPSVSAWELGKTLPAPDVLIAVVVVLDIDLRTLWPSECRPADPATVSPAWETGAMGPKQVQVLLHLQEAKSATIEETADFTGLTFNEARAMLKALAAEGYVFERLGHDGPQPVPKGLYAITDLGMRPYQQTTQWFDLLDDMGPSLPRKG